VPSARNDHRDIDFITSLKMLAMTTRRKTFDRIGKSREMADCMKAEELRKALQKITRAYATSTESEGAFQKLATKNSRDMFVRYWSGREVKTRPEREDWSLEGFLSCKFGPSVQKAFGWLEYGLTGPEIRREEAFWNIVWLCMEPLMQKLSEIRKKVTSDIPMTDEEMDFLNDRMRFGAPKVRLMEGVLGKCAPTVVIQQTYGPIGYGDYVCQKPADLLLLRPAFALAQQLQDKCSTLRFIAECRAPSCGKRFYTGRKNATACPSKSGDRKSPCALAWVRYKRYLSKIGKNPETDWNNKQLQDEFISYDES
jgi:hypothetical protein